MDDVEINNNLRSHTCSTTFLYYSFPTIKNCGIYLAAIIKGIDYKKYKNNKCLSELLDELNILEKDGVNIKTEDNERRIHFGLGLIIGDNLAMNLILGFSASFNQSIYCRFCKCPKESCQKLTSVDKIFLRNIQNYELDLKVNDISKTGVRENCIFNSLQSFHVTTNYSVDLMHDVFEGVCHYNMGHILKHFIKKKYFTLEVLNNRKQNFNYGEIEIENMSPSINIGNINRFHFKMSAREMMTFVNLFSLMIGDLIPENDEVWIFFLRFLEIIKILLSYKISNDLACYLKNLITQHHLEYTTLFNDTLKPKHHLMLHYFNVILESGAPRHFWSFRYESEHKNYKAYARNSFNRKNICVSLAKKFQFSFAYYLIEKSEDFFTVKECHQLKTNYENEIKKFYENHSLNSYTSYSQCTFFSKLYKSGYIICQHFDTDLENMKIFEILHIIVFSNEKSPYVICKVLKPKKYLKHFAAIELELSNSSNNSIIIIKISDLDAHPINCHKTIKGINMIRPFYYDM